MYYFLGIDKTRGNHLKLGAFALITSREVIIKRLLHQRVLDMR